MRPFRNIWLVDDDEIFVYVTQKLIERTEITDQVTVFKNGQIAIDYLREINNNGQCLPEIVLLDLMMPVLDGWGFLEEYLHLYPVLKGNVTLYILSSSFSPQDILRAGKIKEVRDFIVKPLTVETLNSFITCASQ